MSIRSELIGMVLSSLLLIVGGERPLAAQQCPATDNDVARDRLEYFLTEPGYAEDRAALGVATASHGQARVVTNASPDAAICQQLRNQVQVPELLAAPWIYTIYEIDGRYYMVWVRGPLEQTRIRIENGRLRGMMYRASFSVFDGGGRRIFSDLF